MRHRAHHLEHLAAAGAELAHQIAFAEGQVVVAQQLPQILGGVLAEAVEGQLEVLCHRQLVDERAVLVGGHQAETPGVSRSSVPELGGVDLDTPGVRGDQPRGDLDHRRLAGAILADQGVDLTGSTLEADVVEGDHPRVCLGDACEHQPGWRRLGLVGPLGHVGDHVAHFGFLCIGGLSRLPCGRVDPV